MRDLTMLEIYRNRELEQRFYGCNGDNGNGLFIVPSPTDRRDMFIIVSDGDDWDHVSVSRKERIPNWLEMEHVKKLFFKDNETAVQFHVPVSDHINFAENCLHLWRSQRVEFPRPPQKLVGVPS